MKNTKPQRNIEPHDDFIKYTLFDKIMTGIAITILSALSIGLIIMFSRI